MAHVKFLNKRGVIDLNRHAMNKGWNRTLEPSKLRELPDDVIIIVGQNSIVDDGEAVRARLTLATGPGGQPWLDIPISVFNRLPYWDDQSHTFHEHDGREIPTEDGAVETTLNIDEEAGAL